MRPINPQTLIEDLWLPLLVGAGALVLGMMLWKSLDPRRKLIGRDYQILLLFAGFVTLFGYTVMFYYGYAARLWSFSVIGFTTVVLMLGGIFAGLVAGVLRLRAPSRISAEKNYPNRISVQPSPRLRRWHIVVIVWASICILGTLLAICIK